MDKRYRLIFWGPGHVGGTALKEALRRPEFEVVGGLGFSPEKEGVDLGQLVGAAPIGVAATRDKDAISDLDADCVIDAPMPALDDTEMAADVERLLDGGRNVVSAAGYHYPAAPRKRVLQPDERGLDDGR